MQDDKTRIGEINLIEILLGQFAVINFFTYLSVLDPESTVLGDVFHLFVPVNVVRDERHVAKLLKDIDINVAKTNTGTLHINTLALRAQDACKFNSERFQSTVKTVEVNQFRTAQNTISTIY